MANTKSAAKRARQTERRSLNNRRALTALKGEIKKTRAALGSKNKETSAASFKAVASSLDKAAKTGRIHKNAANRKKSRLNKALVALSK